MIVFFDLFFAVLFAFLGTLAVAAILVRAGRAPSERAGLYAFLFFVILLMTWGVGVWFVPVGAAIEGAAWLGFLLVAMVVSLLLIAALTPGPPRGGEGPAEVGTPVRAADTISPAFGITFWVLAVILILFILANYLGPR